MTNLELKLAAMLAMLIQHCCYILPVQDWLCALGVSPAAADKAVQLLAMCGGISFPLFAFCAAEACRYTASRKKYIIRLLLFSLLSEVPYQLTILEIPPSALQIGFHNVMVTFLLSVCAISWTEWIARRKEGSPAVLFPGIAAAAAAQLLDCDFGGAGVLMVLTAYFVRNRHKMLAAFLCILACHYLIMPMFSGGLLVNGVSPVQVCRLIFAAISLVMIAAYNGKPGRKSKWLFYIFYPAHLLALYGIGLLVF